MTTIPTFLNASPAENLQAVVDYLIKIAGKPDADSSTGLEINGTTIDYFDYKNAESGAEKFGVDIKHNNGLTVFHCVRYRCNEAELLDIQQSPFFRKSVGPDEQGNFLALCHIEQTMELEVEKIIDFCISVIGPELKNKS
jgi:hypothetical protein